MAKAINLRNRAGYMQGSAPLYPGKGECVGKTTVKIGNRDYAIGVFLRSGETRTGKETVGWLSFTVLDAAKRSTT